MQKYSSADLVAKLTLKYIVSVPDDYKPEEKLPMIVFLHGAGERGENLELVKVHGVLKHFEGGKCKLFPELRTIVLAPQCPDGTMWQNQVPLVMELIDRVAKEYNADPDRISITGLSMGGFGSYALATQYPDYFSALAMVCGGGPQWHSASLTKMAVRLYHGVVDSLVPVENSVSICHTLQLFGGHPELILYENYDHNSWDPAYESDLIKWLTEQKRQH